jgi:clan AA aspartic protease
MGKRIRVVDQMRRLVNAELPLGEVRVKIKLTNAFDEALSRVSKRPKKVRSMVVDALVDTGSVRTVIPSQVLKKLGLNIRGKRMTEYADGRRDAVDLTDAMIVEWDGRDTMEEALVLGNEVLIGQTVLEKLDLFVDCAGQRLVPNPAHPDQPVTKVK